MKKQIYRPHVSISQGSSDIFLHFLFSSSIRFVDFFFLFEIDDNNFSPGEQQPEQYPTEPINRTKENVFTGEDQDHPISTI